MTTRLAPLDLSFFAMESASRAMHFGGVFVLEPPPDDAEGFASRLYEEFVSTPPTPPFDRRPVLGLRSLPHWRTVEPVDMGYHVRRLALPAPGSMSDLVELASHLYTALLDRTRPLWECYVIEGLEGGRVALFFKLHHAILDGASGMGVFFGPYREEASGGPLVPPWAPRKPRERRSSAQGSSAPNPLKALVKGVTSLPGAGRWALDVGGSLLGPSRERPPLPFSAPHPDSASRRMSAARSFATFDLSADAVRAVARAADGTTNDVVLATCDAAMQAYLKEVDQPVQRALVACIAVSTRNEEDERPSNAFAPALVALGDPGLSPEQRLAQIIESSTSTKRAVREAPGPALQLYSLALIGSMAVREELPIGRAAVPNMANLSVSNIPRGPKRPLYLGPARLMGAYAMPIVAPSQPVNFTLMNYAGTLCFGIGAARNVIGDTPRLAELACSAFAELHAAIIT